ncbi:UBP25, partial [Symbiodinium sp. KB8]
MAATAPAVGFYNLGSSCFINASMQAVLGVPVLVRKLAAPTSETERHLQDVLNSMHLGQARRIPEPFTRTSYNGRQEDAAEFLVRLLDDCEGLQLSLRGQEVPRLLCQHCGHGRNLPADSFLHLQLTLQYEAPLLSVQEAIDRYLQQRHIADDFRGWSCWQSECINKELAEDPPLWSTNITQWPEVLMLSLKRWNTERRMLAHKVDCTDALVVGDRTYRLQSLVAHIGASADSGHYVAYRRQEKHVLKCNDQIVTILPDFVLPAEEKAYILYYVRDNADASDGAAGQGVIDLDSDSDVIVQEDAEVIAALSVAISKFTVDNPQAEGYISQSTIRNWVKDHSKLDRAISAATPKELSSKMRVAPVRSARASLPEFVQEAVGDSLQSAQNMEDFLAALRRSIPDFSESDVNAENYIPRTTLRRWFLRTGQRLFNSQPDGDEPKNWDFEVDQSFAVSVPKPGKLEMTVDSDDDIAQWLSHGAWTFCPHCGRRRPRSQVTSLKVLQPASICRPRCDPTASELLHPRVAEENKKTKLDAYVTPNSQDWEPLLQELQLTGLPIVDNISKKDLESLAVLDLKVEFQTRRGGNAQITTKQKKAVIRGRWKSLPLVEVPRSDLAKKLFCWLLANNDTYAHWVSLHQQLASENKDNENPWRELSTASLLLRSPGIEVAARPWLYPLASYADSDLLSRLAPLNWVGSSSLPSIRTSFMRKLTSRCIDYGRDFALKSLLYDTAMAKTITSLISVANQKHIAPEFASMQQDMFEGYWLLQLRKMEDVCRREHEKTNDFGKTFPNIFFTIAPAEWRYLLPEGLILEGSLSDQQDLITLHLHHTMRVLLELQLINHPDNLKSIGIASINHWSFRFEFQSRADVQCGDGNHNLMKYVAGYLAKASDALQFVSKQTANEDTKWRQAYRLLCKRSPTEQEIVMEFAGLSMVKHSFTGTDIFAPIPGSDANNNSRRQYEAYQRHLKGPVGQFEDPGEITFIQWLRLYQVISDGNEGTVLRPRNQAGPAKGKPCGVAMSFPFELLDIYVGAWAASCLPGMLEERLLPDVPPGLQLPGFEDELCRRRSFAAPQMCQHLKAVLCLNEFLMDGADPRSYNPDLTKFFAKVEPELLVRGINADRISTFMAKIQATHMLLLQIRDGHEDAGFWTAADLPGYPRRQWSAEQQAVLTWVQERLTISDAAETRNRILQVSGSPGTGKTEVVIAAAKLALDDDCRVLIAGPIGLLVAMYRLRLPANDRLTMETIHSAFKLTRPADAAYIPPGRLRRYDVIIFDEVSQIDGQVWDDLKTALAELHPGPLILFVGDFQQLQPVHGLPQLQLDLDAQVGEGTVDRIDLKNHNMARSIDPSMLAFLNEVRERQPSRRELQQFFAGRIWSQSEATARAKEWEDQTEKSFTFLTVTNKAAASLNRARLALDFPREAELLASDAGIPAENGNVLISSGMRIRLTYNVNKQEGF